MQVAWSGAWGWDGGRLSVLCLMQEVCGGHGCEELDGEGGGEIRCGCEME